MISHEYDLRAGYIIIMRRLCRGICRFSEYKDYKDFKNYKGGQYQKNSEWQGGHQNNPQSNYQSPYQHSNENVIESTIDVKNYNLMLSLEKFNLSLFIIPPAIIKKAPGVFEIRKGSSVLGLLFIPKSEQE